MQSNVLIPMHPCLLKYSQCLEFDTPYPKNFNVPFSTHINPTLPFTTLKSSGCNVWFLNLYSTHNLSFCASYNSQNNNINRLVFIMDMQCIFCELWNRFLNIFYFFFVLFYYYFLFLNFRFQWVIQQETDTDPGNTKSSVDQTRCNNEFITRRKVIIYLYNISLNVTSYLFLLTVYFKKCW